MTKIQNFNRTKRACFFSYVAMSSIFSLPPLLFVTFHEMYGVSYTLLGTLMLVNFCTQLLIDLIFTGFAKYFNVKKTLRVMPLMTATGLIIFASVPLISPENAYIGLITGTVIFSIAAGLSEVLLSPTVASLPSDNPERDMSTLHSLYAYGVVMVVVVSTVFLRVFGTHNWMYLTFFWATLPLISFVLFCISPIPEINITHDKSSGSAKNIRFGLFLCFACIFLGSAAENSMTDWISSYVENALGFPKVLGDICGLLLFAILLGIGRTLYAKYGKNISNVLLCGMIGASVCYLVAGFSDNRIACLIACVIMGFCTSMLWPGTLILMEEKFPAPGIAAYALMAAGGDFGASVVPQLLGIVIDKVSVNPSAVKLAESMSLTPEQIGMKAGMIVGALFPILGTFVVIYIKHYFKKKKNV